MSGAWLMTMLTSSPVRLALTQIATTVPVLMVGLPAGAPQPPLATMMKGDVMLTTRTFCRGRSKGGLRVSWPPCLRGRIC